MAEPLSPELDAKLCDWTLPDDATIALTSRRCLRERNHDGQHTLGDAGDRSAVLFDVNEADRTMKTICHARLERGGPSWGYVELAALCAIGDAARLELGELDEAGE